ncbi:CerR family C-terminal domain-containing protein [Bosea sp. (in: a-proteobacteria)]|uniref:CerR family C-terminal domain-containing protein n=1 Tax=Bosea sp. (in: a-proteobacteria) TaxID=1871050 RepID=UPI001ACCC6D4|nr:CerR family C-terminal domain-containing protein [Bosea sp. (in: a-proteobacteria)]MBN9440310.1 CerR family C-terminal domain-containing protein [Bosea sp. (in: a-proteobacteria)]
MARVSIIEDVEGTRQALIRAGLDLFGRNGFDATSTREIAQAAGVNSAGIAYHFGGKDGLRQACAEAIIARMQGVLTGGSPAVSMAPDVTDRDAATEQLLALIGRVVSFLTTVPESEVVARFVMREMLTPSPAFEALYGGLFEPVHRRVCQVWAAATGMEPEAPETKLAVFAAIGQVFYFRIARPAVTRRLGWDGIDAEEARLIGEAIRRSVRASILACRGEAS